jgi:hypothetical protein
MRQATVPELALDEETEGFIVQHVGLSGYGWRNTPDSPESRRPETPTLESRCRCGQSSTYGYAAPRPESEEIEKMASEHLRLERACLVIPDMETPDMKDDGYAAVCRGRHALNC